MSDAFKTALRHAINQVRAQLPIAYQLSSSNQVCAKIRTLDQYRRAKRLGLYFAVNGEIDLRPLWNSSPMQGKFCHFPALTKQGTLLFLPATPNTPFKNNRFGILEPDVSHDLALPCEQLDLLIMPLVAFDSQGTRLGMGAGYYDKTLQGKKPKSLLGVAYGFQQMAYLEPNPWDVAVDGVVTPQGLCWTS